MVEIELDRVEYLDLCESRCVRRAVVRQVEQAEFQRADYPRSCESRSSFGDELAPACGWVDVVPGNVCEVPEH